MKRRLLISAFAGVALVATFGVAAAGESEKISPPGTLAALERAPSVADALPDWYTKLPAAEHMFTDQAKAVGEVDGRTYYLVPGRRQTTCLIYITATQESAGTCAATSSMMSDGLYFTEVGGAGEQAAVTAIALPDGFDSATLDVGGRVVEEGQNLRVLVGPPPMEIILKGGDVRDVRWEVGLQSAPG